MAEQPMYRQIADDLRQKIESGAVPRGSQLPTELELREQYDASRNTIRDAIKWLTTRGLVETRPGQGTFVVEKIDPLITTLSSSGSGGGVSEPTVSLGGGESAAYESEAAAQRRTPRITVPRVEIQQAQGVIAGELDLNEGSTVVSRHQRRFIDERLWSLQTTFYPMRFVEGAPRLIQAEHIERGAVKYIADELGVEEVGYRDTITVRSPDLNETGLFGLPSDGRVAVVEIFRTGFARDGAPIRLTVTVFPADRNKFVINVGQVPELTGSEPGSAGPGRLRAVGGREQAAPDG
jgi:GntR family transcriptional regulator